MTEHEAERLAHWVRIKGWPNMSPEVREGLGGQWGVSINGFEPIYYLWEWPFFLEWWNSKRRS